MLSENLQRKDLSEVEKAEAVHEVQLLTQLTLRPLAVKLGVSHVYIKWLLDFHGFPTEVKQMVKSEEVSAKSGVSIGDPDPTIVSKSNRHEVYSRNAVSIRVSHCVTIWFPGNHLVTLLPLREINKINYTNIEFAEKLRAKQLTPSQLAMVAARIKGIFEEDAKRRQEASRLAGKAEDGHYKTSVGANGTPPNDRGRSNEQAAKLVGTSGTSVKRASRN